MPDRDKPLQEQLFLYQQYRYICEARDTLRNAHFAAKTAGPLLGLAPEYDAVLRRRLKHLMAECDELAEDLLIASDGEIDALLQKVADAL